MSRRGVLATSLAATLVLAGAAAAQASVSTSPVSCVQPDGRVSTIVISGGTAYLGGSFTHVKDKGGATVVRNRLAAVSTATCALLPWAPSADNNVLALAVRGSTVWAGGDFTHIGTTVRNHLAALDAGTGALGAFNPNVSNTVRALAVSSTTLYAGGTFTSAGGTSRGKLAAFSTADGSLAAWKPKASGAVNALAMSADGSDVYVGGTFTAISGVGSAAYLAAVK
ncbi:MAG: PKD domain-containing protein, partial [Oryzihumus sp.]